MTTVISVENLSKTYRLGQIGTGTFTNDLNVWWAKLRGNPNPLLKIGQGDRSHRDGEELWALRDVSFTVQQGEVLGIIGRNGAGKSTLLKILSRVTAPTSGKIKVKGRIASLLEVGTGFHPDLTGRENVFLNGAILGMSRKEIDRKFDEIIDFAEIEKFVDTPVKRYSSGMYVRLAFAVAAHLESEILVVDEVLAVGDAEFQKKCLGKMGEVAKQGRTVLFVSHNIGMIRTLCDRCLLLDTGKVIQDNKTDLIIAYYLRNLVSIGENDGEITWREGEAPESEEMVLKRIRVINTVGQPSAILDVKQAVRVVIDYEMKRIVRGMRLILTLITQDGEIAFTSTDDFQRISDIAPGMYQTICTIPPDLLNQKSYLVKIRADIPNIKWLLPDREYLSFKIWGGGGQPGNSRPEKWPGVVSPVLEWNTKRYDSGF